MRRNSNSPVRHRTKSNTISLLLLAGMIVGLLPAAQIFASPATSSEQAIPNVAQIEMQASSLEGVELKYATQALDSQKARQGLTDFDQFSLPGAESMRVPGKPALPMLTTLVAVPADAKIDLASESKVRELDGSYTILPAERPKYFEDGQDMQPVSVPVIKVHRIAD